MNKQHKKMEPMKGTWFHWSILTRSWICLYRSSNFRGVLKNRCSEICCQNPWKIPMKKFIFSKVAGWQSAIFSTIPWGFYSWDQTRSLFGSNGLSEAFQNKTTKFYLDYWPVISNHPNGAKSIQYLKKLLILKRPLTFLDITCSAYLIGILIQAEKNCINHS